MNQVGMLGEVYWCEYNITEELCNQQLEILIEAWTFTNAMVSNLFIFIGKSMGICQRMMNYLFIFNGKLTDIHQLW
jgi:hypothetical protein